jgi:hypothetical protein
MGLDFAAPCADILQMGSAYVVQQGHSKRTFSWLLAANARIMNTVA